MAGIRISLDKSGLRVDANRFAMPTTRRVTRRILTRSAVLSPVDTGRLRASGRMKVTESARGPRGIVEYTAQYAAVVHDGSGPHVIRARKKKALAFKYQGRQVVVRSVRHPGSRGKPFLVDAAREVAGEEGLVFRRRA